MVLLPSEKPSNWVNAIKAISEYHRRFPFRGTTDAEGHVLLSCIPLVLFARNQATEEERRMNWLEAYTLGGCLNPRVGRFDLSRRVGGFVMSLQDDECGGFVAQPDLDPPRFHICGTAQAMLTALALGQWPAAERAGDFLVRALEAVGGAALEAESYNAMVTITAEVYA